MQHELRNLKKAFPQQMLQQQSKGSQWRERRMKLLQLRKFGSALLLLSVIMLVLSLQGCALLCPKPNEVLVYRPSPIPSAPLLNTPIPSQSYSSSAAKDISEWQKKLTDTHPMH